MRLAVVASLPVLIAACGGGRATPAPSEAAVDLGLASGYSATLVLDKLMNPSGVSFAPDGALTVCDSGHGRVIVVRDGKPTDHLTGFATEFWKLDPEKKVDRYKLGPLSAIWLGTTLAVSDGGHSDGSDAIVFYAQAGTAADGERTNSVPPTTQEAADRGEGNNTGMALAPDGDTLWVCGHGVDSKTWLLRAQRSTKKLEPWIAADEHGIAVNAPMQALVESAERVLVIYSGAGGKEDGLIVRWDVVAKKPLAQWTLPGLVDPMGLARIPGSDEFAVVDNNWALTQVNEGRLARVKLPEGGGAATVTVIGTKLRGPVSCAFGPDRRLYIAQLGAEFDKDLGQVVAVAGF